MEKIIVDDRYYIIRELGHGGYATVFLANDLVTSSLVAIKVVECNDGDTKRLAMFKQEAMTMAAISSSNVAKVYGNGIYDNNPYLVMEYVHGHSLKDIIKENGYLLVDEVYAYLKQIIDGLEMIHALNIVHRDIKSNNIIKKSDGSIVLIDFGTAFIYDSDINLYQEDGKTIIGTVQYMAPELKDNPQGTIQTDIYALGITIFEMFTGKYPFNHQNKIEVLKMHIYNAFPSVRKINPNVPVEFEKIIYKCCEKNPNNRYRNVNELRIDLINAFNAYKNPETIVKKRKGLFRRRT